MPKKPKNIEKDCKKHGLCRWVLEGRGYYRCTKCRMAAVTKKRQKIKTDLVAYKGGKCEICGYDKCIAALEFHHRDHKEKEFGLAQNGNTFGFEKAKKEADKCILICANCHRELHFEEGYSHNKQNEHSEIAQSVERVAVQTVQGSQVGSRPAGPDND
jgi:hypothetical protein